MTLWVPAGREDRGAVAGDVRAAKGGTTAVANGLNRSALPQFDSAQAFHAAYYASWLVNRACNVLAGTIAQLPFRAGRDLEKPSEFSQNAPLARLLGPPPEGPNPETSARALWKLTVLSYMISGKFAWEIENGARNSVAGVWYLSPGPLSTVPEDNKNKRRYFKEFKYAVDAPQPITYKREEVVYGWNASPENIHQADSPLRAINLNTNILLQLDRYQYAFMANDAKPANIVVTAPMPTREDRDAFRRKFLGDYRGVNNAGKTAFMEVDPDDTGNVAGMLDVKMLGTTAREGQFRDVYEQQLRAVSGGTGVPMSLLDASGRTFDNAGQEAYNYYDITVMPLLADLQDVVNRDLAPKVGNELGWFDISSVPALKPKLSAGMTMTDISGDTLRNERRGFAGLGPVDEVALEEEKEQAIEMQRATFAATSPAPDPASAGDNPDPAVATTNGAADDEAGADDVPPAPPAPVKKAAARHAGPEGHDPVVSGHAASAVDGALARARLAAQERTKALLARQVARWDTRSLRACQTRTEGKRGRQALDTPAGERSGALFDLTYWTDEARAELVPVFEAALAVAEALGDARAPAGWAEARGDALARVLAGGRLTALDALLRDDDVTQDDLAYVVDLAHPARDDDYLTRTADSIVDEALNAVHGISRDTVRDLLTKLTAGELDLDSAMKEIA